MIILGPKLPPLTQGVALVLIGANEDVREALTNAIADFADLSVTTLEGGETRGIYGYGEALALEADILVVDGYPKTGLMRNKLQEIITSHYVVVQQANGHARTVKCPKYVIIWTNTWDMMAMGDKYYRCYRLGGAL